MLSEACYQQILKGLLYNRDRRVFIRANREKDYAVQSQACCLPVLRWPLHLATHSEANRSRAMAMEVLQEREEVFTLVNAN